MDNRPKSELSLEAQKAALRAQLLLKLDLALVAAQQLTSAVSSAFPQAAKACADAGPELTNLTVDERLTLGNRAAGDLGELAFALAPNAALDALEPELAGNTASRVAATSAILKAQATPTEG